MRASVHRPVRRQAGFSLVEIAVCVNIIAALVLVSVDAYLNTVDEVKMTRAFLDSQTLARAAAQYDQDVRIPVHRGQSPAILEGRYLTRVPQDPWGGTTSLTRSSGRS